MKLVLEGISKAYGSDKILNKVYIEAREGELLTILGPSGVGKSTILKIIAGLIKEDEGRVLVDGIDISNYPTEVRNLGYIFQSPLLFPHLTVEENIAFGLKIKKWPKDKIKNRSNTLVKLLKLEGLEKRLPNMLSGGQQQRVAIARSLAPETKILLMDEPFSSLDPNLRAELGTLIKEIQDKLKLTIVFVTHDIDEALTLSDEICFLMEGMTIERNRPQSLYYQPKDKRVAEFLGPSNFIKGIIIGNSFHCGLGKFHGVDKADGEYVLFFRPDEIEIGEGTEFKIKDVKVKGKKLLYTVGNEELNLLVEASGYETYAIGHRVALIFPYKELHFISK